jgi:hypothetical protein
MLSVVYPASFRADLSFDVHYLFQPLMEKI